MGARGLCGEVTDQLTPMFNAFKESILDLISLPKTRKEEWDYDMRSYILQEAMACCHAITYIGTELIGDPLEIKMFESTKWNLYEHGLGTNSSMAGVDIVLATVSPLSKTFEGSKQLVSEGNKNEINKLAESYNSEKQD